MFNLTVIRLETVRLLEIAYRERSPECEVVFISPRQRYRIYQVLVKLLHVDSQDYFQILHSLPLSFQAAALVGNREIQDFG